MTLGRSRRKVLVIDSGRPCNTWSPQAHNVITLDGKIPPDILRTAKEEVLRYDTVSFVQGTATAVERTEDGFDILTDVGDRYKGRLLLFATGVSDRLPDTPGLEACWGVSLLHCPYCHGYEVRDRPIGILGSGEYGFEFARLLYQWSKNITVFTNGEHLFTTEQFRALSRKGIRIMGKKIERVQHKRGQIEAIHFDDTTHTAVSALFTKPLSVQHCSLPAALDCETDAAGLLKLDMFGRTTQPGVYAAGDNSNPFRSISAAMAAGTKAAAVMNRDLVTLTF